MLCGGDWTTYSVGRRCQTLENSKFYATERRIKRDKAGEKVESPCWKCGAKLVENARFCHVCGSAVHKDRREEFSVSTDDLIQKVKQLIHEGNITRIVVRDEKGRDLLEMPVTVGVVGVILAPWLAALGAIAALAANCTLVVEREQ